MHLSAVAIAFVTTNSLSGDAIWAVPPPRTSPWKVVTSIHAVRITVTTQAAATIRISAITFRSLSFRELGAREAEDRNLDYGGEGGIITNAICCWDALGCVSKN